MVQLLTGTNTGNCIKISSSTYSFSVTKNSSHSILKLSADVRVTLLAGSFKSLHTLLYTIHACSLPFDSRRDNWREFVSRKQTKVSRVTRNTVLLYTICTDGTEAIKNQDTRSWDYTVQTSSERPCPLLGEMNAVELRDPN